MVFEVLSIDFTSWRKPWKVHCFRSRRSVSIYLTVRYIMRQRIGQLCNKQQFCFHWNWRMDTKKTTWYRFDQVKCQIFENPQVCWFVNDNYLGSRIADMTRLNKATVVTVKSTCLVEKFQERLPSALVYSINRVPGICFAFIGSVTRFSVQHFNKRLTILPFLLKDTNHPNVTELWNSHKCNDNQIKLNPMGSEILRSQYRLRIKFTKWIT